MLHIYLTFICIKFRVCIEYGVYKCKCKRIIAPGFRFLVFRALSEKKFFYFVFNTFIMNTRRILSIIYKLGFHTHLEHLVLKLLQEGCRSLEAFQEKLEKLKLKIMNYLGFRIQDRENKENRF